MNAIYHSKKWKEMGESQCWCLGMWYITNPIKFHRDTSFWKILDRGVSPVFLEKLLKRHYCFWKLQKHIENYSLSSNYLDTNMERRLNSILNLFIVVDCQLLKRIVLTHLHCYQAIISRVLITIIERYPNSWCTKILRWRLWEIQWNCHTLQLNNDFNILPTATLHWQQP